ncbi:acyl-CoA dehydrogenase [Actinokineospora sp. 24-640]
MGHYRSDLRDLRFALESSGLRDVLISRPELDMDWETAVSLLAEVDRLAREQLAASFVEGDRTPPVYDRSARTVTVPPGMRRSYQAYLDSEFWRMDVPAELGGVPVPRMLWWAVAELLLGAHPALWMYSMGMGFAGVLHEEGTAEQRELATLFVRERWAATMVLTEPDAGSDVGSARTRARLQPDGTWHLEGVKRFITSGEHDLAGNIIHYVLARPVGIPGHGGPGTKGLSLFVVPRHHFDPATGEVGERNGVRATAVEDKMGLNGSVTCELTFGAEEPAVGWLMGDTHDGIRQMFRVIERARMVVGTKAMATLSTGYLTALDYARTRVQGAELSAPGSTAPRVPIIRHADVRRSLLLQKAYAEGLRALVVHTAAYLDRAHQAARAGDEPAAALAAGINELLLPVVKGFCSERAYELLGHETLQTFGGSGFLRDHPVEQYVRDSKIDTLYEGTTAIQAQDLIFRKIVRDRGAAFAAVVGEIRAFCEGDPSRSALRTALEHLEAMVAAIIGHLLAAGSEPERVHFAGAHARRLLLAFGDVLVGWLLARQAEIAGERVAELGDGPDAPYYRGKAVTARFFADEVLPRLASDRAIVESATVNLATLPDDVFG